MSAKSAVPDDAVSHLDVFDYETLHSTQSEAKALHKARVKEGCANDFVVSATHQSAGQGRNGRVWHSGEGNVALTFCLRFVQGADVLPVLAFGVGLYVRACVLEALDEHAVPDLRLKWPNDLVVLHRGVLCKVGGILIDTHMAGDQLWAFVGIGLNVASAPRLEPIDNDATCVAPLCPVSLTDLGAQVTSEMLVRQLCDNIARLRRLLTCDRRDVYALWQAHAFGLGARIEVVCPQSRTVGLFQGVGESGALQVLREDGTVFETHASDARFRFLNDHEG